MEDIESVEVILIEIVELEEHSKVHGTEPPHARHYAFRVPVTFSTRDIAADARVRPGRVRGDFMVLSGRPD